MEKKKQFLLVSQVLSFRLRKKTSENTVNTIFEVYIN